MRPLCPFLACALIAVATGCGGACGKPPAQGPTVVTIPAFGQWPAIRLLLEVTPKPVGAWDVTPLANAVYLAARQCPEDLKKGAFTARFAVAQGKTAAGAAHSGGTACVETAVLGREVPPLANGTFSVVANGIPVLGTDAGT
jgi:hypothetical protein